MKKQFLFILISCISSLSFAQGKILVGPSIVFPVGDFGSKDDLDGGFANPGIGVLFENQSRGNLWPNGLYFLFHLSYNSNKLDKNRIENLFREEFMKDGNVIDNVVVNSGNYRPLVIALGPLYEVLLNDKMNINFKGGIGFMFSNVDPIQLSVLDNGGGILISRVVEFRTKPSFMYLLGFRLGYRIAKRSELSLFADYSNTKTKANIEITGAPTEEDTQPISFISTGLTLSFGL